MRLVLFVFLAFAARLDFTPYFTEAENADVQSLAAGAATDRSAQDKKICQVRHLKMRGTKIPGSAYVAMRNHHAMLLLFEAWGESRAFRRC
jgi:hypothetical protein